jgi:hypothetical protein
MFRSLWYFFYWLDYFSFCLGGSSRHLTANANCCPFISSCGCYIASLWWKGDLVEEFMEEYGSQVQIEYESQNFDDISMKMGTIAGTILVVVCVGRLTFGVLCLHSGSIRSVDPWQWSRPLFNVYYLYMVSSDNYCHPSRSWYSPTSRRSIRGNGTCATLSREWGRSSKWPAELKFKPLNWYPIQYIEKFINFTFLLTIIF